MVQDLLNKERVIKKFVRKTSKLENVYETFVRCKAFGYARID